MNELSSSEQRGLMSELKSQFELYLLYRRYEKMRSGEIPWEARFFDAFAKSALKRSLKAINARLVLSWRRMVKRTLDIAVSLTGIALSAPVMLLVAIAVKLESKG